MAITLKKHYSFDSVTIESLPEEVLVNIFSYLNLAEICNTVAKVCKHWEKIHWNPVFYRLPTTVRSDVTPYQLLTCMKDAQHLASPYYNNNIIRETIQKSLDNYIELREMKRGGRLLVHYKFAKELDVMFPHLSHVSLINLPYDACSEAMGRFLILGCAQLEELKLYGVYGKPVVRSPTLIKLCEKLCGTLRVLHVDCVNWNLNVVDAIYKCRLLHDLAIREAKSFSSQCLFVLANMSTLRRLQIASCFQPNASDWIIMISSSRLKDLTSLALDDCSYNDSVALAVATNLKNLTELTMVTQMPYKPSTKRFVSNKGLDAIIKSCNKLTLLEISFGSFGDRELSKTLMSIPEYLPNFKKLTAIRINTSIKWKTILKGKKPDVLIRESLTDEFQ